jgi:hypothetical protein
MACWGSRSKDLIKKRDQLSLGSFRRRLSDCTAGDQSKLEHISFEEKTRGEVIGELLQPNAKDGDQE